MILYPREYPVRGLLIQGDLESYTYLYFVIFQIFSVPDVFTHAGGASFLGASASAAMRGQRPVALRGGRMPVAHHRVPTIEGKLQLKV